MDKITMGGVIAMALGHDVPLPSHTMRRRKPKGSKERADARKANRPKNKAAKKSRNKNRRNK